jgi:hypothetical protein
MTKPSSFKLKGIRAMLETITVLYSLSILTAISLPVGYLAVNTFQIRNISGLSFISLFPLYLAMGLIVQVLLSYLFGTIVISPAVPVSLAAACSAAIVLLSVLRKRRESMSISPITRQSQLVFVQNRNTDDVSLKSIRFGTRLRRRFGNLISLALIVIIFVYFASIPISTQWPPIGDGLFHAMLTSLTVYNGHIPTDLRPLINFPYEYPSGYHVLASDFSLMMNFNSAESIYIIATYLTILISASLFVLTYFLTRSYWVSLPIPFAIIVSHNTGSLEMWLAGFLVNGPYPGLFAIMTVITTVIVLQISYGNRAWKGEQLQEQQKEAASSSGTMQRVSFANLTTILVIISLALFTTYPQFLFHIFVVIMAYCISELIPRIKKVIIPTALSSSLYTSLAILHRKSGKKGSPFLSLSSLSPTLKYVKYVGKKLYLLGPSIIIFAFFVIIISLAGLLPFYDRLFNFNVNWFETHSSDPFLDPTIVIAKFFSDSIFGIIIVSALILSFTIMILKRKPVPICIVVILLLIAMVSGFSIIYPERTGALVVTLSWVMLAYGVYELAKRIQYQLMISIPGMTATRKIQLASIIISVFVLGIFYFEAQYILYQIKGSGWHLSSADVDHLYSIGKWLEDNVGIQELVLNDMSYSGMYLQAFGLFNLTHNYWSGEIYPGATPVMPAGSILREMNHLLLRQYTEEGTPLPAVSQPVSNDIGQRNKALVPILSYNSSNPKAQQYSSFSGSNYTDVAISADNQNFQLTNFSVGLWFKANAFHRYNSYMISKGDCCSERIGENMNYGMWMTREGRVSAGFEASDGSDYFVTSVRNYTDGKWHYAVVTYDHLELRLYVDGALAGITAIPGVMPDKGSGQPIRIGANRMSIETSDNNTLELPVGYFDGEMYDIKIWDKQILEGLMQHELSRVWTNPGDQALVNSLLKKYNVKYIVISGPESGFKDFVQWGGTGNYEVKPVPNEDYIRQFDSYDFLKLMWKKGNAAIYAVEI